MIFLYVLAALALLYLLLVVLCYLLAFYVPPRKPLPADVIEIPRGKIYEVHREQMEKWTRQLRAMPCEQLEIRSFDGLRLTGRLYEYSPDAPLELMFHGYRGSAERDMCGGVQRCFSIGRSALIVDQRCSGNSEGSSICFAVKEYRDCLEWLRLVLERFPQRKIILTGISMGASTVLTAAGERLPENVIGVLADCGFSSAEAIIKKVIRQLHLPAALLYPPVKLAARIFAGFDLEENPPVEAVKRCTVPVIFYHGEEDNFVPCDMSRELYEACDSRKKLVTVPGAGHGLSYVIDPRLYLSTLYEFFGPEGSCPGFVPKDF